MRFANWKLKKAIAGSGKRSYEIELMAGLPRTKLSRISNGITEAHWHEKESIAEILGKSVEELFPLYGRNK